VKIKWTKGDEHNFTSKQEFKSIFDYILVSPGKIRKKCRGRDLNP
jgi:hypothetical protein